MKRSIVLTVLVATGAVAARPSASHAQAGNAVAAAEMTPAPKRNSSVISEADIRDSNAPTAYEVVSRLRPAWLRKRGVASVNNEGGIKVYQDGMPFGGLAALRQISATGVQSIEFLDGMRATQRFGTDHGNGVILVTTRR